MISEAAGNNRGWTGPLLTAGGLCLAYDVHAMGQTRAAPKISLLSSHTSRSGRRSGETGMALSLHHLSQTAGFSYKASNEKSISKSSTEPGSETNAMRGSLVSEVALHDSTVCLLDALGFHDETEPNGGGFHHWTSTNSSFMSSDHGILGDSAQILRLRLLQVLARDFS